MKKIAIILSSAALAVMGTTITSCDKLETESPYHINPDGSVTYTVTVKMSEDTKSLSPAMGSLVKTFDAGKCLKLTYDGSNTIVSNELKNTDLSNSQRSATFTFTFETLPDLPKDTQILYEYPAAHTGLDGQDGTLLTLANKYDYAKWGGKVIDAGVLPTPGEPLANQYAIGQFTIKDSSNDDITSSITEMIVSDGTNTYTISRSPADGPIWVAMQPVDNKAITVTATDGSYWYNKTTESAQTLAASKIYPINVTMTKFAATLSASAVGEIVGSDGRAYDAADINNLPTGVTASAMVAYKNGSNGLAISLTDIKGYQLTYAQATGEYGIPAWSASHPIAGCTWRIPTEQDWQRMMWGYYVENPTATNISAFQTLLGATYGLVANGYYWTGSEVDTDNARAVLYDGTYAGINNADKGEYYHVRACLEF